MFLKKVDFLSPPITLFYQGFSSHSSPVSGILSIATLILAILFSVHEIIALFKRNDETPSSTSFTYFKEDVGTIVLNTTNLFHFISFEDYNNKGTENFDFSYLNVIGIEEPVSNYENNNNLKNYNHWLYGYCNNKSDIKGIEKIVTNKFLTKSACIKKYYDKETDEYYDTNHPKIKWPSVSHGTFHPENKIYSIIIKSCEKKILNYIFNGEYTCKNIDDFKNDVLVTHFNFIDEYVDILKYKSPVVKYSFRIESKYDNDHYSVNHLNFNPAKIKSNIGYFLDNKKVEYSFYFERNDVLVYERTNDIYMAYTIYLNNRIKYYERTYKTIPDVLTVIGGTLNIFIFIMTLFNDFFGSFIILNNFNELLGQFYITEDDIEKVNKRNILNKTS